MAAEPWGRNSGRLTARLTHYRLRRLPTPQRRHPAMPDRDPMPVIEALQSTLQRAIGSLWPLERFTGETAGGKPYTGWHSDNALVLTMEPDDDIGWIVVTHLGFVGRIRAGAVLAAGETPIEAMQRAVMALKDR
jgi:hypothetical protein